MILPRKHHITQLIVRHFHERTAHSGRGTTLNEIRANGFWITQRRATVASYIWKCVLCRKLRAPCAIQKIPDLPEDRLEPSPPFTYTGVDYLGPCYVGDGPSNRKRWGVLFICLVSRAIHLEVAWMLDTDSFRNAYRRFVGRRGPIRLLRSDRGTHFVGAKSELEASLAQMDNNRIHAEIRKDNCDWINIVMNFPHSSHMGCV